MELVLSDWVVVCKLAVLEQASVSPSARYSSEAHHKHHFKCSWWSVCSPLSLFCSGMSRITAYNGRISTILWRFFLFFL